METSESRKQRRLQLLSTVYNVDETAWPTQDEMPETDVSDLLREAAHEIEVEE